jgi:hypothetical protein
MEEETTKQTRVFIKALGDWEVEVLGIPYGSEQERDSDGEYFTPQTALHEDKYGLPPAVHYHGMDKGQRPTKPEYIGRTLSYEDKPDGRWYRVALDKGSQYAAQVWEAVQRGTAAVSSGASHLARVAQSGKIEEWPVTELSIWDNATGTNPQANPKAIALPAKYQVIEQQPEVEQENGGVADETITNELPETKSSKETNIMSDENEVKQVEAVAVDVAAIARDAIKAYQAELAKGDKQQPDNDPGFATKAATVNVIDETAHWKYDNVESSDLAFGIGTLESAKRSGQSRHGASLDAIKALAKRLGSEETGRSESGRTARQAFKASGIKANEINQSTLANYGDEWVGVYYSGSLWESIRQEASILARVPQFEVPQGAESVVIPLESTDPTWYKVAQSASLTSNPGGIPTNTVTSSNLGTANKTLTLGKMGARVLWTGELEEDAVLPYVNQLRMQLAVSGAEYLESVIIDGDTEAAATTNINSIGGTPGGGEHYMILNGFRKLALVTNTANSRDGGTLTSGDFLETVKLMGVGGSNADVTKTAFIMPWALHWKALELEDVKTRDVFTSATIESGRLTGIYGYPIYVSHHMHKVQPSRLANTAGKIDLNTAGNNTTSALLAVRFDQWTFGWRRRMTLETTRIPAADATEIVALMRFGMVNRDTEASAISYNLGV